MFDAAAEAPTVRLASATPGPRTETALRPYASGNPALLISYAYYGFFAKHREKYAFRDWALDSGAFSAHNSGKTIVLQEYIDLCLELMRTDPTLTDIFALDVIGDHEASRVNAEIMWDAGVPVIPAFHPGEPWSVLEDLAREFPKIALGGVVRWKAKRKLDWVSQCFARAWPARIHGFGMASDKLLRTVPFHSTDASSWETGPCAFGNWRVFGDMSVRGGHQNLRAEVESYLRLETELRQRWSKEMALLRELPTTRRNPR